MLSDAATVQIELPKALQFEPRALALAPLPASLPRDVQALHAMLHAQHQAYEQAHQQAVQRAVQQAVQQAVQSEREQAARQVQSTRGKHALLHLIELEPWSQLPERRWALVPFTGSRHPAPSM